MTIDRDKTSINLNENKDSLLLATLAYNVGYGTLMGNANHPKSRLIQKIESGGRNIHNDYIRFCRYKGKVVPSIRKRRKKGGIVTAISDIMELFSINICLIRKFIYRFLNKYAVIPK